MGSFSLERFPVQTVLCGYILFILSPYLAWFALWLSVVLWAVCLAGCALQGPRIDRVLYRYWDRLDSPNKKAAVYFGAAFAPMLWWPLTGFKAPFGLSLFTLGLFAVPPIMIILSKGRTALLTGGLAATVYALGFPNDPPGALRVYLALPPIGMLMILLPYTILVLGLVHLPLFAATVVLTRMSLTAAIESGNVRFVRRLLDAGHEVDGKTGDEKPLHWAARLGKAPIVSLLLDRGALIDPKNGAEQTPLMLAARADHTQAVRILIDNGADLTAADSSGKNALQQARGLDHDAIVEILEKADRT